MQSVFRLQLRPATLLSEEKLWILEGRKEKMARWEERLSAQIGQCVEEIGRLKEGLCALQTELQEIRGEWNRVKERNHTLEDLSEKLESRTSAVQNGQLTLRKELNQITTQISDTYSMALDAWGKAYELSCVYDSGRTGGEETP